MVAVAWRDFGGPGELLSFHATNCMLEYLTESSISPLKQAFVECDDPLASSVDSSILEQTDCVAYLVFSNVPYDKIDSVKSTLVEALEAEVSRKVDLERMRVIVDRRVSELLSTLESDPHEVVNSMLIGDFLYSKKHDKVIFLHENACAGAKI